MTLEEKVTRGFCVYISSIDYAPIEQRLTIRFLGDPESSAVVRTLTFSGVEDFSEETFGDEDVEAGIHVTDSLIGLDEYPEEDSVRYVVHTEVREMIFRTKENPKVEDVRSQAI